MTRTRPRTALCIMLALVCQTALMLVGSGCEANSHGLLRPIDPQVEHTITNTVTIVTNTMAPLVPAPFGTGIEIIGGAVLGLLAAWQALTHKAVKQLQNGNTPTGKDTKT